MKWVCMWVAGFGAVFLFTGCSSVLPSTQTVTKTHFTNYAQVQAAFAQITLYETHTGDLRQLGFDPAVSPNVRVLTYVEVMQRFMPNPAITKTDLAPGVRACIEAHERGHALEVELSDIKTKRYGNALLDIFGFKRRTHETGWRFRGLILTTNSTVVYKLSSGEPMVANDSSRIRPLGPLQELDSAAASAASKFSMSGH